MIILFSKRYQEIAQLHRLLREFRTVIQKAAKDDVITCDISDADHGQI